MSAKSVPPKPPTRPDPRPDTAGPQQGYWLHDAAGPSRFVTAEEASHPDDDIPPQSRGEN